MREHQSPNGLVYLIDETLRFEVYTAGTGEFVGEFTAPADAERAADADSETRVGLDEEETA